MRMSVTHLLFLSVVCHKHIYADHTGRNSTTEPYENMSSPSLSTEEIPDEAEEAEMKCDTEDIDYVCITLYTDCFGSGNFSKYEKIIYKEDVSIDKIYSNIRLPQGMHGFLLKNVSCILYNILHLNCSWAMENVPENAQYSLTVCQDGLTTSCDCFSNNEAKLVECNGKISDTSYLTIRINVSLANFYYIHSQEIDSEAIVKLNAPHNINASVISGSLHVEWAIQSTVADRCFHSQLRIKSHAEKVMDVLKQKSTTLNIDQTQSYQIQIRVTKTEVCKTNGVWSDWSEIVVVDAWVKPDELNALMVLAVSLAIPMFLLALILLCWRPRLLEKVCPPVPSPSIRIQELLEKDDFIQVTHLKYFEEISKVEDNGDLRIGEEVSSCIL